MSESLEDAGAVDMHSLLLSLAGLIDDELLGWCRELVAVGESDFALELVTATVQADRVRLPGTVHGELQDAAVRRRVLGRADTLPAPDNAPRMRHRFTADPGEHGFPSRPERFSPAAALQAVPARLLRDCRLWLTWRISPAGGAPGPVPHPVVLVEVADGAGADVLAYQVAEVLSRAGVFASVEVFAGDGQLGDYHRAALAEAQTLAGEPAPPRRSGGAAALSTADTGGFRAVSGGGSGTPDGRRAPLHPVDRVIAARGSGTRRPQGNNTERLDDVASGLNFERGSAGETFGPEKPPNGAPNGEGPGEGPRPSGPRDVSWGPGQQQPPPQPQQPPAKDAPRARPVRPTNGFPGGQSAGGPSAGGPPTRPMRPGDAPDQANLSDVEQRLLRQLHEELAAREDDGAPGSGEADQPPSRMFRGTNGGRKRPPPRNGPDRAS